MMRIGHGYDVHRIKEGRPLYLGGIRIPCEFGLDGHSDADVLIHAVMDALLGASGNPDIGQLFPPSDDSLEGIRSTILLDKVRELLNGKWEIDNIDCTILAQRPKIGPYIPQMRKEISSVLQIPYESVNIKATTEEGLGFTGSGEGMAAHSVCLIHSL